MKREIRSIKGSNRCNGEDTGKGAQGNGHYCKLSPGPIATEMYFAGKTEEMVQRAIDECPHGRLGQSEDVAPFVGFLATDASEWVNVQVIRANNGLDMTMLNTIR